MEQNGALLKGSLPMPGFLPFCWLKFGTIAKSQFFGPSPPPFAALAGQKFALGASQSFVARAEGVRGAHPPPGAAHQHSACFSPATPRFKRGSSSSDTGFAGRSTSGTGLAKK